MNLVLLPLLSVGLSAALVGLIKIRNKDYIREDKRNRLQSTKLRVTTDVLKEYETMHTQGLEVMQRRRTEKQTLEQELHDLMMSDKRKSMPVEIESCKGAEKIMKEELDALTKEATKLKAEFSKEKSSWETQLALLKNQMATRSKVCDYVKKDATSVRSWCGDLVQNQGPGQQYAQAQAPNQQQRQAQALNQQQPQAQALNQQQPQVQAPNQQQPQVQAPNQQQLQAQAPNQQQLQAQALNQQQLQAQALNQQQPQAQALNQQQPQAQAPNQQQLQAQAPNQQQPQAQALNQQDAQAEKPKLK